MAVVSNPISSELILVMDNGTGASGQALTISRRYANVKSTAVDGDLYDVATSILGLQDKTLVVVERRDTTQLENVV